MEIDLNCTQCSQDYKDDNPPRLLTCGHTFCHACLQNLLNNSQETTFVICPEDQQSTPIVSSLEHLPKNIALLKLIQGRKKNNSNNSSSSIPDGSFDVSKINRQEEFQEDQVAEQLISQINRATQHKQDSLLQPQTKADIRTEDTQKQNQRLLQRSPQKQPIQMCLLHQKPIEVVCMNDCERLCSKCALFGEHKNHDFKSVEEIQRENRKYYQLIIKVFEDKATFMEKVSNKTFQSDLLELLSVKISKVKRQIGDKFKKLVQDLAKTEKNALKKLEEMNGVIEQSLIAQLKPDERLSHSYDSWQQHTLEVIKQSQKPSNEDHLTFYLRKDQIVHEGQDLLTQLQKIQQNAYDHTVQIIEDFNITFHDSGYQNMLANFVDFMDKGKEQNQKKNRNFKQKENQATFANLQFQSIKKSPHHQHHRHESQQSLLDACDFETQSFAGDIVGSRILEQSFVSVRADHLPHHKQHKQLHTTRPLIKRKVPVVKDKQKFLIKQPPTSVNIHNSAKRKMKNLKVPQKYEKVIEGIMNDALQVVDFTNAELGDSAIFNILEMMKDNVRVKTVKLIRNKLTDDGIAKMLPYFTNIISLNLSQNQLTDHVLNLFIDNRHSLPMLKSLVLSQTKIVERKSKTIVQRLKKMEISVSV